MTLPLYLFTYACLAILILQFFNSDLRRGKVRLTNGWRIGVCLMSFIVSSISLLQIVMKDSVEDSWFSVYNNSYQCQECGIQISYLAAQSVQALVFAVY